MSATQEQPAAADHSSWRAMIYVFVAVGAAVCCFAWRSTNWHSTAELHTVMEAIATTLALVVAATTPCRYYSDKDNQFLFIGAGFFATALLDGYHTVVTSMIFRDYYPSPPESLTAWSWMTSRTFLAVLMVRLVAGFRYKIIM